MKKINISHIVYFLGLIILYAVGEPLNEDIDLTWRNIIGLCVIPYLFTYAGYALGWINAMEAEYCKNKERSL
jgi:predicted Na+-dependent transporter